MGPKGVNPRNSPPKPSGGILADTVQRLRRDMESSRARALPARATLARQYGVSVPTIARALRLLEQDGLVRNYPRRRTVVVTDLDDKPQTWSGSSRDTVLAHLERMIADGELGRGDPLPKVSSLAASMAVSNSTVVAVYSDLCAKGAVHRRGRRLVVGTPESVPPFAASSTSAVIVVVSTTVGHWGSICKSLRIEQFAHAFMSETRTRGISTLHCALRETSADYRGTNLAEGIGAIAAAIRKLGTRYSGALVAARFDEGCNVGDAIRDLLRLGRPVVWFDSVAEGLADPIRSPLFYRCLVRESAVCETAARFLVAGGHRRALYSHIAATPWHVERGRILRETSPVRSGQLRIDLCPNVPPARQTDHGVELSANALKAAFDAMPEQLSSCLDAFSRPIAELDEAGIHSVEEHSGRQAIRRFAAYTRHCVRGGARSADCHSRAEALWAALDLAPLFLDPSIRAVIFPNDYIARLKMSALAFARFDLRKRCTVVSFDNAFRYGYYPITTVDFGFERLGHQAFHAIMGDVRVRRTAEGDIEGNPFIVDWDYVKILSGG